MANVLVLGCGMVGSVMALDLAADPGLVVTAADGQAEALEGLKRTAARLGLGERIKTIRVDASSPAEVRAAAGAFDLVCCALPSRFAFSTVRTLVEARKHVCDISFVTENTLELDDAAKKAAVSVVVDCGVAPGMSHILAAHGAAQLDRCDSVSMYVGGLPVERRWPFEYKAAFSPSDVIEEYTRPSRVVEQGRVVIKEALSEPELMDFPGVGTLEAFNTDGLRSMATTYLGRIPNMKEKTLRYPGHIELMRVLREMGLFGEEPIQLGRAGTQTSVVPRELIAKLMFPMWTYQPGEADLTVMRVSASGIRAGAPATVTFDVLDKLDPATGFTSMSRTTAFPCVLMAREILAGTFTRRGVIVPEYIGEDAPLVTRLLRAQAERGVQYRSNWSNS